MQKNSELKQRTDGQSNSVQLNIVTFIDMDKAIASQQLEGAYYMMDNSIRGVGQGTESLQTVCQQGQILNWIVYAMDNEKQADGTWPPMPKINNIVFLDIQAGDGKNVAEAKVCTEFKVYGMPHEIRSEFTPVYSYWAGMVIIDLKPGIYLYQFVIELEHNGKRIRMSMNGPNKPSIKVCLLE
jgi:hypothetical protein